MKKLMLSTLAALVAVAMSATAAFAANFTPSVEQKGAPSIAPVRDADGNEHAAYIKTAEGTVEYVDNGDIIVTPIAKSESADPDIQETLEAAYQQIKETSVLTDLTADLTDAIAAWNTNHNINLQASDLVVRDVYDVTLTGAYQQILEEGGTLYVRFQVGVSPNDFLAVLHNYADDQWEVIPDSRVERFSNGDITVAMTSLSPFAIVVEKSAVAAGEGADGEGGVTSPQTSDINYASWIIAFISVAGVAAMIVRSRKREN